MLKRFWGCEDCDGFSKRRGALVYVGFGVRKGEAHSPVGDNGADNEHDRSQISRKLMVEGK